MDNNNPFFLTILYAEPGKKPEMKDIFNTMDEMDHLVHGKIDSIGVDDGICVIYNALAETLKMEENCTIYGQKFFGPIIIVEFNEAGNLVSIDQKNFEYYAELIER